VNIIVKCPGPARFTDQVAGLIFLTVPESMYAAMALDLVPFFDVNMPVSIQRSYEFVAVFRTPKGKVVITSQFKANFPEGHFIPLLFNVT